MNARVPFPYNTGCARILYLWFNSTRTGVLQGCVRLLSLVLCVEREIRVSPSPGIRGSVSISNCLGASKIFSTQTCGNPFLVSGFNSVSEPWFVRSSALFFCSSTIVSCRL